MSEQTPYQTPGSESEKPPPLAGKKHKSSIPKVFGILHMLFGIFGVVSLVGTFLLPSIFDKIAQSMPAEEAEELQKIMENVSPAPMVTIVSIVLALVMIVAGILLLKYKDTGRSLTNGLSVLNIVWVIVVTVLNYQKQLITMKIQLGDQVDAMSEQTFNMIVIGSMAIGALASMIYPVLSLIFLNKGNVKKDLN